MRRGELIFNIGHPLFIIGIMFLMLSIRSISEKEPIAICTIIAGFILFVFAKMQQINAGIRNTFGTKGMSKVRRCCYVLGYVLMILGCLYLLGRHYHLI